MVIEGERVYLRPLTALDATEQYLSWLHDPEVTQYLEVRHSPPSSLQELRGYIKSKPGRLFLAIILKDGDRHIGNIKLGHYGPYYLGADVGILIGEKTEWGRGYGSEAIELLAQYASDCLGLFFLTAGHYPENIGSGQAFLKAGWQRLGSTDKKVVLGVWL